jgi:NodT family efflux transporter outer membrane factor (OMF) lipoprotein
VLRLRATAYAGLRTVDKRDTGEAARPTRSCTETLQDAEYSVLAVEAHRLHASPHVSKNVVDALSFAGVLLAATACTVGPDYVRPQVTLNSTFNASKDPRLVSETAIDIAWWKTFNDATLDNLIELAYQQNLSLQIAGLRILEARAALAAAFGDWFPKNIAPIGSAQAVGLSEHGANQALVDHHFGSYQVGFDAVWELDFWGRIRREVRAAHADYLATVADYDDALVSLSAEVARTYVLIRTVEVLIDQAHQNVAVQEDGLRIAQARFTNGATSELDVAQATNLLETTRTTIPELEIRRQQAENALSTLLGRPTGYVRTLLGHPNGIPAIPGKVSVSVPAEMLRRRPDIRGAELRAIAQCNRVGVATAELYPKFTLFGSIGTDTSSGGGVTSGHSTLGDLFGPGSLAYRAGGSVFWPILNYPTLRNNVRVADARFEQALMDYVITVLNAAREVDDGVSGLLNEQDAVVFAQNAVTAADNGVKLALIQYKEGAVDYTRVLDTQRALLDSQNHLANARSAAATSLISLYKALGGGWELRAGNPVVMESIQHEMQRRTNWDGFFQPRK